MAWEVNWNRRMRHPKRGALVWARNPDSTQARARKWHWTTYASLAKQGVKWQHAKPPKLRYEASSGYVVISIQLMTPRQIEMADRFKLWIGKSRGRRRGVKEHHLAAAEKYGGLPRNFLVRHRDGNKANNRPSNLLLGTQKDNSTDHHSAVRLMMYWRERALKAEGRDVAALLGVLKARSSNP